MNIRKIFNQAIKLIIEIGEMLTALVALTLIFALSLVAFLLVGVFHLIGILYQNLTHRDR